MEPVTFLEPSMENLPVPTEWKSYTIVVACVGVGNVSQLACDLLIFNLHCTPFAAIDFQYLPAVVGVDPYNTSSEPTIMTCSQLYVSASHKIIILQTRSPPFPKCRNKHVEELSAFLRSGHFDRIILLSSSFGMQRQDAELLGSQVRYATSVQFNSDDLELFKKLNWSPLLPHTEDQEGVDQSNVTFRLPGSGIANYLFEKFINSSKDRVCLLNVFASEGDNTGDALYFVERLNQWLNLLPETTNCQKIDEVWRSPPSWSMLYGNNASELLY